MEKIVLVIHASNIEWVDFEVYQLKGVAYQWYDEWEVIRGENAEIAIWKELSNDFLDHFFPRELR